MRHAVLAVLAVLAGCASPQSYTHASRTAEEFESDKWQCHAQGVTAGAAGGGGMAPAVVAARSARVADEVEESCLKGKGYKLVN